MAKVLLVTDSEWVINDVHAELAVGNWDVEVLGDPAQAVSTAREVEPEAVIVDMQIRSMGGMAVIRDVRAAFEGGRAPHFVLLLDREADTFLAKRAGADAWLVKPFRGHDLRNALLGPLEPIV